MGNENYCSIIGYVYGRYIGTMEKKIETII